MTKLDKKVRRALKKEYHGIGISPAKAARRLVILDKVLALFGMRVGAYQTAEIDFQNGKEISIRLTVYFMEG